MGTHLSAADLNAADRNLDATYLVRMYSVFERAVGSYWRQLPNNQGREVDGGVVLDEVVADVYIDQDVIESVQEVRRHRNNLAHQRFEAHALAMTIEDANRDLLRDLQGLPATWA